MQKGEKPSAPIKLRVNGVNSSMLDLDIGAAAIDRGSGEMKIIGFRVEYTTAEQYKTNMWKNALFYDVEYDPRMY